MKPAAPPLEAASLTSWTAELADETRRHLAFSCYCAACSTGALKPMQPDAEPAPSEAQGAGASAE